jgi:rhomboid protease GluP
MLRSSVPAIGFPILEEPLASNQNKAYSPKPGKQLRLGLVLFGVGLLGLIPLWKISKWMSGGAMPDYRAFAGLLVLLCFPLGLICFVNALRGLPRLVIGPSGVKLESATGAKWANWDSLAPFALKITYVGRSRREIRTGTAKVVGYNASKGPLRLKTFAIPDYFEAPIATVVSELNAARGRALGESIAPLAATTESKETPVGLVGFRLPWLTLGLLTLLIVIFIFEIRFAVTPGARLTPSVPTLFAFGALSRTAVLSGGEWYRLFTAPLLHASLAHITGNAIALLLGGILLERLVGRMWYFAIFSVGALCGSLASLVLGPPYLVSVGASGALMGMFAALFVCSFRLTSGTHTRLLLQLNSLRILIPSLLPLFSSASVAHIDYGAHLGGALSGVAVGVLLLRRWPETARIPQARTLAFGAAVIGVVLFAASAGAAIARYPRYDIALIPQTEVPKTAADVQAHGAALAARYPDDPRSHVYLSQGLAAAKDYAGAERELRLALAETQAHSVIFVPRLELAIRSMLVALLVDQGRLDEAKDLAGPLCTMPVDDKGSEHIRSLLNDKHLCG